MGLTRTELREMRVRAKIKAKRDIARMREAFYAVDEMQAIQRKAGLKQAANDAIRGMVESSLDEDPAEDGISYGTEESTQ